MELKSGVTYQVWTGYRIWYSTIDPITKSERDGDSFEFSFNDPSGSNLLAVTAGAIAVLTILGF